MSKTMEVKVAHLHPDRVERYEQLHRDIPAVIEKHLRESGVVSVRIFREGLILFMIVESDSSCEVPNRVIDQLLEDEWHRVTGECFALIWQDAGEIYRLKQETA